jgi:aspartoacylase
MSELFSSRWSKNSTGPVVNVAVVGGTHGNELHGIYMVRELNSEPAASQLRADFPSLRVQALIGNPAAVAAVGTGAGRRYVDVDLNRCFLVKDLADTTIDTVEGRRARELDALLGPKSSAEPQCDFIFDLHSTTSNTGILLCVHPNDEFSLQLIAYLHTKHANINSCLWSQGEVPLLPSIARSGITVEVGPISHSTANASLYERTKSLLRDAMEYIDNHNNLLFQSNALNLTRKEVIIPIYERVASIGYPRDVDGNITGLVHPTLQGGAELNGGTIVKVGDPIFQMLHDSSTIYFRGLNEETASNFKVEVAGPQSAGKRKRDESNVEEEPQWSESVTVFYPMFINEAAYNEKDIAFVLMRKLEMKQSIVTRV